MKLKQQNKIYDTGIICGQANWKTEEPGKTSHFNSAF